MSATTMLLAVLLAYSDPARFAEPAADGGGGGRQFTGSNLDGYSCAVCHHGGPAPRLVIDGMPERFEPDTRYDVAIRWLDSADSHALQLELVDERGGHPRVELPDLDTLPVSARCDGDPQGSPAVYAIDLGDRRIIGVQDCGATELRFTFTPEHDDELIFAASVVRSDSSGAASGDGVLDVRRRLERVGTEQSGCSLGEPRRGAVVLLAWLGLVFGLRRRHSNRTCNIKVDASAPTRSSPTKAR